MVPVLLFGGTLVAIYAMRWLHDDRPWTDRYGAELKEFSDLTKSTQACFALMLGGDNFSRMMSVTETGTLVFCAFPSVTCSSVPPICSWVLSWPAPNASSCLQPACQNLITSSCACPNRCDYTHLALIAASEMPPAFQKLLANPAPEPLVLARRLELGRAWPADLDEPHFVDPHRRPY